MLKKLIFMTVIVTTLCATSECDFEPEVMKYLRIKANKERIVKAIQTKYGFEPGRLVYLDVDPDGKLIVEIIATTGYYTYEQCTLRFMKLKNGQIAFRNVEECTIAGPPTDEEIKRYLQVKSNVEQIASQIEPIFDILPKKLTFVQALPPTTTTVKLGTGDKTIKYCDVEFWRLYGDHIGFNADSVNCEDPEQFP